MAQALIVITKTKKIFNLIEVDPDHLPAAADGESVVVYPGPAQAGWVWNGTAAILPMTVAGCVQLMQDMVDALAKSWGYDSFLTAVTYVGDPNPKYNAEGTAIRDYRSSMWTTGESLLKTLDPANPPTRDAFIAMLPTAPVRPSI